MPRSFPDHLFATLDRATASLVAAPVDHGLDPVLSAVVSASLAAVPRAVGACVTLVDRRGVASTGAAAGPGVDEMDRAQASLGEGPGLELLASATGETLSHVEDIGLAPWPRWAPVALSHGYGSALTYRLDSALAPAALTVYAPGVGAFTDEDELVGSLLAREAAVALHGARRAEGLTEALSSRDVISRAKGILTERFKISDDEAFTKLVDSSQATNMKLRDVAAWLTEDARERGASVVAGGAGPADMVAADAPAVETGTLVQQMS